MGLPRPFSMKPLEAIGFLVLLELFVFLFLKFINHLQSFKYVGLPACVYVYHCMPVCQIS